MNPEVIRAFTPIFLATIGGAIGLSVVLSPQLSDGQRSSGIGLAGTATCASQQRFAIAGAAGLAQSTKTEAHAVGQNAEVKIDNGPQTTGQKAAG
jgi:hypothetical protein